MRKLVILAFTAFFGSKSSYSQNDPVYFNNTCLTIGLGKDESGHSEKMLDFRTEGGYGWGKTVFSYYMTRLQPLGRKTGRPLEQATIVSISVGQVLEVKNSTVAWGGGLAIAVEPNVGSQPRTSKTSPGLNGHVNVENSFFHAAADLTLAVGLPKGQHDWARDLLVGKTGVGMFFDETLGPRSMGS